MYFRVYPSRNTTIFRYMERTGSTTFLYNSDTINTGSNPIMELTQELKDRLVLYDYSTTLNIFDAGTLFEPAMKPTQLSISTFREPFIEGDGYSFVKPDYTPGNANWIKRTETDLWQDTAFAEIATVLPAKANDDISVQINVKEIIQANEPIRIAISVPNREYSLGIECKYLYSRHTRTLFKPYLEFFIGDDIEDKAYSCTGGMNNKIYLINNTYEPLAGNLTASVIHSDGSNVNAPVSTFSTGVSYCEIIPPISTKRTFSTITWEIDNVVIKKQVIEVESPNQFVEEYDPQTLFFYPITPYTHAIVRQGDIVPFTVVSQVRGLGDVVNTTYEYKVTSADGFEMVPWQKVNVYGKKMFFNLPTEFFHPEQQYEVWLRNKTPQFTITSNNTYKFKVAMNDKSHLRNQNASPYYSRHQQFNK
jgi:hypothetical protein